jgi:hypothetical protein
MAKAEKMDSRDREGLTTQRLEGERKIKLGENEWNESDVHILRLNFWDL